MAERWVDIAQVARAHRPKTRADGHGRGGMVMVIIFITLTLAIVMIFDNRDQEEIHRGRMKSTAGFVDWRSR